jgi:hypothetical protein
VLIAPDHQLITGGSSLREFGIRKGRLYYIHQGSTNDHRQTTRAYWGNDLLGGLYVGFLDIRYACSRESNSTGDLTIVVFPVWIVIVSCGLGFSILHGLPIWRSKRRRRIGHCHQCGYDLRGTPDRCPECGFVPENTREIASDL